MLSRIGMEMDMDVLRFGLIMGSASLLLAALLPVRRLLLDLPKGATRRAWHWLGALVLCMLATEVLYALEWLNVDFVPTELMIPLALLAGSWFVMLISQVSAASIDDVHQLIRLKQESVTDSLTGLYNRRHLDERLQEEVQRSERTGVPLSIMMLDADHFKSINDKHGHAVGDQVLVHLAEQIKRHCRQCDVVARFGGEEFVVLAPAASQVQISWQAERLRKQIAATPFQISEDESIHITLSIGIAQLHAQDEASPDKLIKRADVAMYQAKEQGRNQVVTASCPAAERVAHIRDWVARVRSAA